MGYRAGAVPDLARAAAAEKARDHALSHQKDQTIQNKQNGDLNPER